MTKKDDLIPKPKAISSSVSIRKAHSPFCVPNAYKEENETTPVINIEAIRILGRIARGIISRITPQDQGDSSKESGEQS